MIYLTIRYSSVIKSKNTDSIQSNKNLEQLGKLFEDRLFNTQEGSVALFEALVALFEALVALFEALVALFEALVALFEALVALFEALVALFGAVVALFGAVVALFGASEKPNHCSENKNLRSKGLKQGSDRNQKGYYSAERHLCSRGSFCFQRTGSVA